MSGPNSPANATPSYLCPGGGGNTLTKLAITAPTVVKATPGAVISVSVTVAGSAAGGVFDCAATADASVTANEVASIPNTVGPVQINFPCLIGVVVKPGSGQTLAISYQ